MHYLALALIPLRVLLGATFAIVGAAVVFALGRRS